MTRSNWLDISEATTSARDEVISAYDTLYNGGTVDNAQVLVGRLDSLASVHRELLYRLENNISGPEEKQLTDIILVSSDDFSYSEQLVSFDRVTVSLYYSDGSIEYISPNTSDCIITTGDSEDEVTADGITFVGEGDRSLTVSYKGLTATYTHPIQKEAKITVKGKTTIDIGEVVLLSAFDQNDEPYFVNGRKGRGDGIIRMEGSDGYTLTIRGMATGTTIIDVGNTVITITVTDKHAKPIEWLDTSKLLAEILTCGALNSDLYTTESWSILHNQSEQSIDDLERSNIQNDTLENGYEGALSRKLLIGGITQADVDASETALRNARLGLVKIGDEGKGTLQTTELANELKTYSVLLKDEALYTKDSWVVFFKQYTKSEKDLENYLAQNKSCSIDSSRCRCLSKGS